LDARSLGVWTGVQVGTLNAWIQRGLIPDVTANSRGRLRDFDINTATHIAIMADLMRFGIGAPLASSIAKSAASVPAKRCCLITNLLQGKEAVNIIGKIGGFTPIGAFTPTPFTSEEDLLEALTNLQKRSPDGQLPGAYMVVNVERIEARMRHAEEEWRKRRTAISGPGRVPLGAVVITQQ
jgi:hypothetical protein